MPFKGGDISVIDRLFQGLLTGTNQSAGLIRVIRLAEENKKIRGYQPG